MFPQNSGGAATHELRSILIEDLAEFRKTPGLTDDGAVKPQAIRRDKVPHKEPSQFTQFDLGRTVAMVASVSDSRPASPPRGAQRRGAVCRRRQTHIAPPPAWV